MTRPDDPVPTPRGTWHGAAAAPSPSPNGGHPGAPATTVPAGFWQRATAWSLDAVLLGPLAVALTWARIDPALGRLADVGGALLRSLAATMADAIIAGAPPLQLYAGLGHAAAQASAALQPALWALAWPPVMAFALLGAIWHVGFECGPTGATPGQRLLGVQVVDRTAHRLRPARALLRHLAGGASWVTLNLGHLMAAAAPEHLALHDRLSRTRLLAAQPTLPQWARAWLVVLGAAALGITVWSTCATAAALQLALVNAFG